MRRTELSPGLRLSAVQAPQTHFTCLYTKFMALSIYMSSYRFAKETTLLVNTNTILHMVRYSLLT